MHGIEPESSFNISEKLMIYRYPVLGIYNWVDTSLPQSTVIVNTSINPQWYSPELINLLQKINIRTINLLTMAYIMPIFTITVKFVDH